MDKKAIAAKAGRRKIRRATRSNSIPEVSANEVINCPECGSFMKRVQILEAWHLACGKCGWVTQKDLNRSVIRRSGRGRPTKFSQMMDARHPTFREFEAWTMILQEHSIQAVKARLGMTEDAIHHAINKIQRYIDEEIDVDSLRKPLYALAFTGIDILRKSMEDGDEKIAPKLAMDLFKGLGVLKGDVPVMPIEKLDKDQFGQLIAEYAKKREEAVKSQTETPSKSLGDNNVVN